MSPAAAFVITCLALVACTALAADEPVRSSPVFRNLTRLLLLLQVDTVIGIDLGTTYSCVGVYKDGRVQIIANDQVRLSRFYLMLLCVLFASHCLSVIQGNRITPSVVAFSDTERLVGGAAKNQASLNPENTVYDTNRLIGRQFNDKTVQSDMKVNLNPCTL